MIAKPSNMIMVKNIIRILNKSTSKPPNNGPRALPTVDAEFTIPWYCPTFPLGAN